MIGYTVAQGYDCGDGNQAVCAEKADVAPTGGEDGDFGGGEGEGFCMYQIESVDCEWLVHGYVVGTCARFSLLGWTALIS